MRITLWPEKNSWFRRNTSLVLCLMTMLLLTLGISEQGSTIERQRDLIRVLSKDSNTLIAMRAKQANEAQHHREREQARPAPEAAPSSEAAPKQEKETKSAVRKRQWKPEAQPVLDVKEARRTLLRG